MGRQWAWFILVVALLLAISLEAANGEGNGNGNGNSNGNGHGNGNGQGNGNGNGNGNGEGNGNGKGNGNGNGNGSPPYYPPPSPTPPYYPPPTQTPPSSPPPPYVTPPTQTPPSSPPPYVAPPTQTPPSSPPPYVAPPTQTPPSSPPPYVTPPTQTPPSSPPPPQTPPTQTPPSSPPPYVTPPTQTPPSSPPPYVTPPTQTPPSSPPPPQTPPTQTPPSSPPPSQTPPSGSPQTPPSSSPPPPQTPPALPPPSNTPPTTPPTDESLEYYMVSPVERTGQEQAHCTALGACWNQILTCPEECAQRKPGNNKIKGCYIDCSSKCEATCKWRKPSCDNYGSLCYDPRFVGGDGNMFYFHGSKGSDFAIVTDEHLQINAHFIGTRPAGRTRDFTWVQALSIIFDTHTLVIAAKRVSKWDDKVESLIVKWDGEMINIPTDGEAEWRMSTENNRVVVVERTDDYNTVRATVSGLVQVDTRVVPIGEQENKVHHYHIPGDDAFAHLETEFKFFKLSASVEGVLGRTYQPGFESPVKMGVAMPMMGGEDKYQTPSLTSPLCKACIFQRPSAIAMVIAL